MTIEAKVICPYCGHENKFTADNNSGRALYNCFIDEGGCDGTFVVEYTTRIDTKVKRVEGEECYAAAREGCEHE